MNENTTNERVIPFWKIIYKKLTLIILLAVLVGLLGFGYALTNVKPVYTAQTSLILKMEVSDAGLSTNTNNATLAKKYFPAIKEVITSPRVISETKEKTGKQVNVSNLSITYGDSSMIFTLGYSDETPELAKEKLFAVIETAKVVLQNDKIIEAKSVELVELQTDANVSVYNSLASSVVIGVAIGALIGVAIAFLLYFLDNTVKDKTEMEEATGVPVIAYIEKY